MILEEITALNRIIERESKSSTYKFALLRSVIDASVTYRPQFVRRGDRIQAPVGVLVEYWIYYYYPLFDEKTIPQIAGESKNLAFENELKELIEYYRIKGGFSAFYMDFQRFAFDEKAEMILVNLGKKLAATITSMPMKYFGNSVYNSHYSYFKLEKSVRVRKFNSKLDLILRLGSFSISTDFFEILSVIGSILNGSESIINRWADYSYKASKADISKELILQKLTVVPTNSRAISISEAFFKERKNSGKLYCIWSGKRLDEYHLDHLFPYSIMRNNDLWNVMPASPALNSNKSDKIPSAERIEKANERLGDYWSDLHAKHLELFQSQIKLSMNQEIQNNNFKPHSLIDSMLHHSDYLINVRGYESW